MRGLRLTYISLALAVAALAATATAIAATPKEGQWSVGSGEEGGAFLVKGSSLVPAGSGAAKGISAPRTQKCNFSSLILKTSKIKVAGGKFSYDGPAYVDKFRDKTKLGRLVWSGTFTSATKVKGKVRFTSAYTPGFSGSKFVLKKKKCDSGNKSYTGQMLQIPAP